MQFSSTVGDVRGMAAQIEKQHGGRLSFIYESAIKGFAIVLSLGILTSMFTSLMGSRALLTLMYGGKRKVASLSIG